MTRLILSALLILFLAGLTAAPVLAQSPDPAPQPAEDSPASPLRPLLGVIVLGGPAVFMVWRASRKKKIDVRASCCLPVIDENARPFAPQDES